MREKGTHLRSAHGGQMPFVVGQDKAFDPVHVGLFGANAVVFEPDFMADLIEEFRLVVHILGGV
jgi:hypothetical protein